MPLTETNAPLKVSTDGTAGPYVIVTPEQLGPVTVAFREEGIGFRVDEDAVLSGGAPPLAVIDLGSGVDVERIQRVLDRVAADLPAKERRGRRAPTRQELVVHGPVQAMQELTRRLDVDRVEDWTRQLEAEARFRKTLPPRTTGYCFSKRVPAVGRQVAVLLRGRGPRNSEELSVSRIVPLEGGEPFNLKDHDDVIADIRDTLIERVARGLPVRVLVFRVQVGPALDDSLSPEALARLQSFAATANKGTLHPLDTERWASFIKQAHLDDAVIEPGVLAAWLGEEGFQDDQRDLLVREYQSGRRLLGAYEEERQ
jgi:hypothetical protein